MVLSARHGLRIACFTVWNEYIYRGLRGFARGYVTSVEGNLLLQSEPGSVFRSIKFSKQYCSEANREKGTIYKVKKEIKDINGRSVSNPLMERMNYVRKRMQGGRRDKKELKVKEGDIINLMDLLFTENRDYLVKHSDDLKVKAEHLVGKAILLYFVPICSELTSMERELTTSLVDIYYDLLPNNDFEVILVAVNNLRATYSGSHIQTDPRKNFEEIFSQMPWTAIPFSDIASRKRIARRFSISECDFYYTVSFLLDSKGIVLTCNACPYFTRYGTQGYPFTEERIRDLESGDDRAAKQPSLETLLGSPVRDYVISNKEDRVPIHTLKDKVVALYFYEDGVTDEELTVKLKTAYKELAKNKEKFEVVLLYLYDTLGTIHSTNEESFWKFFETMPWLALPFKDPNHKKLKRIFGYPNNLYGPEPVPTLVIFGPNGKFVEPCGADILINFGISAYPFTRNRLAKLETEKVKELKLEMLLDPNTFFKVKKDRSKIMKSKLEMLGDRIMFVIVKHVLEFLPNFYLLLKPMILDKKVPFSQLDGKRLLIYFEMGKYYNHLQKLKLMKDIYLRNKGTDDEFEVIHIKKSPSQNKHVEDMPWLVHYYGEGYSLSKELESSIFNFNCHSPEGIEACLLLAFERDGSIVRKTFYPSFDNMAFPFYAGGLEKEFFDQLNHAFGWYYWEFSSQKKQIYKRRLKWERVQLIDSNQRFFLY
ncbi:probable nucleoredoxin 1 isoform X2 [Daucus carota subsp. sativus]|uniref:probable nucleoredoxin 1 isoform X2 n=1 Tax=Daucus carota subsp. sativus TaxID=79200 RepID=UPI0030838642